MRRLPKTLGFLERKGLCQVDFQVLYTQQWLNSTYGAKTGWVHLTEDDQTGWGAIYGLRRALQVELGVTPIAEGFGPATTNAYQTKVGAISATSATAPNVLRILNGALWCKGYAAFAMGNSAAQAMKDVAGVAGDLPDARNTDLLARAFAEVVRNPW